jgi:hypothetical protein
MAVRPFAYHGTQRLLLLFFALWGQMALAQLGLYNQVIAAPQDEQALLDTRPEVLFTDMETRLIEITKDYHLLVAPLFQKACADCHSGDTQYPWYYSVPGIHGRIRKDIDEAREAMEISNGYPFQSHATPLEDLRLVEKVIRDSSMPPIRYRIMHPLARLNEQEKKRIIDWAKRAQLLLQQNQASSAAKP